MTGPIIPAELWPEDAHLHTWDSNGLGNWLRPSYGAWHLWGSDIPLPHGHDWRVPVMRQAAPAAVIVTVGGIGETLQPGIDLEQFRSLARWVASAEGHRIPSWMRSHADRLLALLDASKNNNLPHVGDTNVVVSRPSKGEGGLQPADLIVEGWPPPKGFQLSLPRGIKLTHKPTGTVVTCDTERSQHANREKALILKEADFKADELVRDAQTRVAEQEAYLRSLKLARVRLLQEIDALVGRTRRFLQEEAPEMFPPAEATRKLDDAEAARIDEGAASAPAFPPRFKAQG